MVSGEPLRLIAADVDGSDETRFRAILEANFRAVLGYALRRTATSSDAADVVSETMLTAWRRLDEMPTGDRARPWLFGVARKVLANQRRGVSRQQRLGERLRVELHAALGELPDREDHTGLLDAMECLDPDAREVIRLATWESLSGDEIATVLGISAGAARARLHRARLRLRTELTETRREPS